MNYFKHLKIVICCLILMNVSKPDNVLLFTIPHSKVLHNKCVCLTMMLQVIHEMSIGDIGGPTGRCLYLTSAVKELFKE